MASNGSEEELSKRQLILTATILSLPEYYAVLESSSIWPTNPSSVASLGFYPSFVTSSASTAQHHPHQSRTNE